jgi:DNA-binding response OmpR family regulator
MARTILVVEDETTLRETLADALDAEGFRVVQAGDGRDALARFRADRPDLVLLDLMLPDGDGRDVAREIRRHSATPIIMLTARGTETDRIVGLELGADDYVVKPFSGPEVIARIRAVLRRTGSSPSGEGVSRVQGLELDLSSRRVTLDGSEIELSRKEFDLLAALMERAGRVVRRETLMEEVWDENWFGSTRTLDTHIGWLRQKLGDDATDPRFIHTVRGVGFRFAKPGDS